MWVSGLGLFPQFQFLKKRAVTFGFGTVKVVEQASSSADHGEEASAGSEVFDGFFEVGGEVVNPIGEESNLNIGGARVFLVQAIPCDDLAFWLRGHKKKTLCEKDFESMLEAGYCSGCGRGWEGYGERRWV